MHYYQYSYDIRGVIVFFLEKPTLDHVSLEFRQMCSVCIL